MLHIVHLADNICAKHSTYTLGCTVDHIPRCFRAVFLITCGEIRLSTNIQLTYKNREFILTDSKNKEKCTIERFMFIDCRLNFLEFCPLPAIWRDPSKTYITWLWHSSIRDYGRLFPVICHTHKNIDITHDPRDALTEFMKEPICREVIEQYPSSSTTLTTNYALNSIIFLWRINNTRNWRQRIQAKLRQIPSRGERSYF